jgi:hypothetical protein
MTTKSIVAKVECRRWFQKTYGNTYHSVRLFDANGRLIDSDLFQPGYGEQCLGTAVELMEALQLIPYQRAKGSSLRRKAAWQVLQQFNIASVIIDVPRKKDL